MLKREIKYTDFNDEEVVDIEYFNLSKPELLELEMEYDQGFGRMLQNIVEAKDNREILKQFKQIVLKSYGKKSEDGKRFMKNDELREQFSQSAAYEALFMELAMDDNAAAEFLKGILPKDLGTELDKQLEGDKKLAAVPNPPTT